MNWRWLKYQCLLFKGEKVELEVAEISMFIEVAEIPSLLFQGEKVELSWLKYQCLLFKGEEVELEVTERSMFII